MKKKIYYSFMFLWSYGVTGLFVFASIATAHGGGLPPLWWGIFFGLTGFFAVWGLFLWREFAWILLGCLPQLLILSYISPSLYDKWQYKRRMDIYSTFKNPKVSDYVEKPIYWNGFKHPVGVKLRFTIKSLPVYQLDPGDLPLTITNRKDIRYLDDRPGLWNDKKNRNKYDYLASPLMHSKEYQTDEFDAYHIVSQGLGGPHIIEANVYPSVIERVGKNFFCVNPNFSQLGNFPAKILISDYSAHFANDYANDEVSKQLTSAVQAGQFFRNITLFPDSMIPVFSPDLIHRSGYYDCDLRPEWARNRPLHAKYSNDPDCYCRNTADGLISKKSLVSWHASR